MIAALKTLRRDAWVLGIACAAALAYAVLRFLEALVYFILQLVESPPAPAYEADGTVGELLNQFDAFPHSFVFAGRIVYYGDLFVATLLLIVVVPLVALTLHASRETGEPEEIGTM